MAMEVKDFDFGTGDMEKFLREVIGLNIVVRNKMRGALLREENEMIVLREIFDETVRREEQDDIRLMTPEFRTAFITLFNMNASPQNQIRQ